jgi:T-complex protein 1 subunit eta
LLREGTDTSQGTG